MSARLALSAAVAMSVTCATALAQDAPPDWSQVKCERYAQAWSDALRRFGASGLGDDFLARHRAFLDSGCAGPRDVCPRTKEELALANVMVIRAMNAGTASTFLPFACPRS